RVATQPASTASAIPVSSTAKYGDQQNALEYQRWGGLAAAAAATITSELDALVFTPKAGAPGSSTTTTFTLSDLSSANATPTVNSSTTVINTDPAGAPTISGTVAGQRTTSEAPVHPFAGVTISDPKRRPPIR